MIPVMAGNPGADQLAAVLVLWHGTELALALAGNRAIPRHVTRARGRADGLRFGLVCA